MGMKVFNKFYQEWWTDEKVEYDEEFRGGEPKNSDYYAVMSE